MTGGAGTLLTTWPEVHAHLAATFGGTTSSSDGALVVVVATIPLEVHRISDSNWLKLTCVIGSLRHLSPTELLATTDQAVIGAHCTRDGQLAIRQTLPFDALHVHDLNETVRAIAQVAVATRKRLHELTAQAPR